MSDAQIPKPAAASKVADIAELVKRMCLALTNVEMYSATHPLGRQSVAEAYTWLQGIFARAKEPVVISISGRQIILDGLPLEAKNPLVAKLAGKLEDLHVTNLFFDLQTSADEFQAFYGILGRGGKYIGEHGGLAALMESAKLQHIRLRDISYVLVTEDQKVVSRDAEVTGATLEAPQAESVIVQAMIREVLKRSEEQRWLLNEAKNNPSRLADIINQGVNLAVSRAEMGLADQDDTIQALMQNIRLIGQNLVDEQTGQLKGDDVNLEHAVMTLEKEIRLRAGQLTSSKVAVGFINEIMAIVTSYTDRIRAKQISDEFIKGERSLKRVAKLIDAIAPKGESKEQFLLKIRDLLAARGITQDDFTNLLNGITAEPPPPKARKPRKSYAQATFDGVAKRLQELKLDEGKVQDVVDSLSSFVEERVRERAGELKAETEQLRQGIEQRNRTLDALPWGIVLWDNAGEVAFANEAAQVAVKGVRECRLTGNLMAILKEETFPVKDPDTLLKYGEMGKIGQQDVHLLLSVARVLTDQQGAIYGVALESPA
jgi:PAS domain-containing protein